MKIYDRKITLRTVIKTIIQHGQISRAKLVRYSGLPKQTMSDVFRHLERDGWVEVVGQSRGTVGRSAAPYQVTAQRAVDFGAIGANPHDARTFHAGALESSIGSIAIKDRDEGQPERWA